MTSKWLTRGLPLLALLGLLASPVLAGFNEASDVQSVNGDASPTAGQSRINDYSRQDEQLNLKATDGLIKVLRTNQKIEVNDYDVLVIPLKNPDCRRELRNVMRQVTKLEGGRAEVFMDKVSKTGAYIELVAPKFMMPYLKDAVAELDVPWLAEYNDGGNDIYVKMAHRKAADVNLIASQYAGDEGFSTIDTNNNAVHRYDEVYRGEEYQKAVKLVDIPCNQVMLDVKMYEVSVNNDLKIGTDYVAWKNGPGRSLFSFSADGYGAHQHAKNSSSIFDPFLDGYTTIYNDGSGKDEVVHQAYNESYRAVNYLLPSSYVDFLQAKGLAKVITSSQLMLCSANSGVVMAENAIVAQVNNSNDLDSQVPTSPEYVTRSNSMVEEYDNYAKAGTQVTALPKADSANSHWYYSSYYKQWVYEYYENGNWYYYLSGNTNPNVDMSSRNSSVSTLDSSRRLNYKNVGNTGISMSLTPYVGLESMELDLDVEIGELNGYTPKGTPIINTRTVNTTVRLLDGQPFVIAGLRRVNNSESTNKAPFIGSIPVVGYLFGGEQTLKRQDDVVITITPKFYLSSQVSIARPSVIDTKQMIVDGTAAQAAPSLSLGFDQYLLGS